MEAHRGGLLRQRGAGANPRHPDGGAEYASPVEFGHGGPHPAPPHPFIRPAFDSGVDEAYEKAKQLLGQALDARGLL